MSAGTPALARREPVLDELYAEHAAFSWRTVRYWGVPAADAEDVVHEVFIVVQRRLADYDASRSMRGWIAGIIRRVVMHYHRGKSRRERRLARLEPPEDDASLPEDVVAQRQAAALLQAFLAGLDATKREIFVLGELEGMTGPEIAEIVGRNVNTVYAAWRAARMAFEKLVARQGAVRRREGG